MKAPQIRLKTIQRYSAMASLLFFASCNSFQPGTPPPPGEPIIVDPPPVVQPAANGKPIVKPKEIDGQDAVNYMLTSLATQCRPIASAGKKLPAILNRFTVAKGSVNDLPMEVWQKLIRNKMIKPISDPKNPYDYSLVSQIESLPNPVSKKKKYLWKMRLLKNTPNTEEVWQARFEFIVD